MFGSSESVSSATREAEAARPRCPCGVCPAEAAARNSAEGTSGRRRARGRWCSEAAELYTAESQLAACAGWGENKGGGGHLNHAIVDVREQAVQPHLIRRAAQPRLRRRPGQLHPQLPRRARRVQCSDVEERCR